MAASIKPTTTTRHIPCVLTFSIFQEQFLSHETFATTIVETFCRLNVPYGNCTMCSVVQLSS